jgi:hypothetical protein
MNETGERSTVGSEGTASQAGRAVTWFEARHAEFGVSGRGVPFVSHKLLCISLPPAVPRRRYLAIV